MEVKLMHSELRIRCLDYCRIGLAIHLMNLHYYWNYAQNAAQIAKKIQNCHRNSLWCWWRSWRWLFYVDSRAVPRELQVSTSQIRTERTQNTEHRTVTKRNIKDSLYREAVQLLIDKEGTADPNEAVGDSCCYTYIFYVQLLTDKEGKAEPNESVRNSLFLQVILRHS